MSKKKKEGKYFSIRNYVWYILIAVAIVLLLIYCIEWISVKRKDRLINSYLISTNTLTYEIKDLSEIEQVLKESPSEYFILISYSNNEKTYKLEKKLKSIIDSYKLNEEIYYVNITDYLDNEDLLLELNDTFNTKGIVNTPCILYYKDNLLEKVIVNKDGVFSSVEFKNLLEEYEFQK